MSEGWWEAAVQHGEPSPVPCDDPGRGVGGRLRRQAYMCAYSGFSSLYSRSLHNTVKQLYAKKKNFNLTNNSNGCFSADREAKTCSRIGRSRQMSPLVKLVTKLVRMRSSTRLDSVPPLHAS